MNRIDESCMFRRDQVRTQHKQRRICRHLRTYSKKDRVRNFPPKLYNKVMEVYEFFILVAKKKISKYLRIPALYKGTFLSNLLGSVSKLHNPYLKKICLHKKRVPEPEYTARGLTAVISFFIENSKTQCPIQCTGINSTRRKTPPTPPGG